MISFATGSLAANIFLWVGFYVLEMYHHWWRATGATATTASSSMASTSTTSSARHDDLMPDERTTVSALGPLWLRAYRSMPVWHFSQLFVPGITAGVLLSISMFSSILAVTYLGQGIGNSVVQCKILVSGLWGIFWFGEIRGRWIITKWFTSAVLAVCGILWLRYERTIGSILSRGNNISES